MYAISQNRYVAQLPKYVSMYTYVLKLFRRTYLVGFEVTLNNYWPFVFMSSYCRVSSLKFLLVGDVSRSQRNFLGFVAATAGATPNCSWLLDCLRWWLRFNCTQTLKGKLCYKPFRYDNFCSCWNLKLIAGMYCFFFIPFSSSMWPPLVHLLI